MNEANQNNRKHELVRKNQAVFQQDTSAKRKLPNKFMFAIILICFIHEDMRVHLRYFIK